MYKSNLTNYLADYINTELQRRKKITNETIQNAIEAFESVQESIVKVISNRPM